MHVALTPRTYTQAERFVEVALTVGAIELIPELRRLKNGRMSPYFFNSGLFHGGASLAALTDAYVATIRANAIQAHILYGPPYKGTLLVPAIALNAFEQGIKLSYATSRKEAKAHGESGIHMGAPLEYASVLNVDDVITTGGTKSEALKYVENQGGTVAGVLVAFDREETADVDTRASAAQLFSQKNGVPVYAAATLSDLISVLRQDVDFHGNSPGMLEKILAYKEEYGVLK